MQRSVAEDGHHRAVDWLWRCWRRRRQEVTVEEPRGAIVKEKRRFSPARVMGSFERREPQQIGCSRRQRSSPVKVHGLVKAKLSLESGQARGTLAEFEPRTFHQVSDGR